MAYYRLYFLNVFSGHIDRFEEFDAAGDASAIVIAKRHCGDVPLELWCEGRKVRHFGAQAGFRPPPIQSRPGWRAEAPADLTIAD